MGRLLLAAMALALGLPGLAGAAVTQTFSTAQSQFPEDIAGGDGPNQGFIARYYASPIGFVRGNYQVSQGREGESSFFSFDLGSACEASAVTLQVVRGVELEHGGTYGGADVTFREVTTPAFILNVPGGVPGNGQVWEGNAARAFPDLADGPVYGGGPWPLDGSPSDELSYPLNSAGVAAFNAARGDFFSLGASGGGRTQFVPSFVFRNPIFAGVRDPAELVVTCALPSSKSECAGGAWREVGYDSHYDCVRAAEEQARLECIFIRARHGVPAFRTWYGSGVHKRHAMRRCVRDRVAT